MARPKLDIDETQMEKLDKGGRPRKEIDYDLLSKLCRILCTGEECAAMLDMSYETLNNHLIEEEHGGFLEYNKRFAGKGKASLRRMQWKGAESGNTSMLIWLGKQYLAQTDKQDLAHTSPDGSMTPKAANLTDEQLMKIANGDKG